MELKLEVYVEPLDDELFSLDIHTEEENFAVSEVVESLDEVGDIITELLYDELDLEDSF